MVKFTPDNLGIDRDYRVIYNGFTVGVGLRRKRFARFQLLGSLHPDGILARRNNDKG